MAAGDGFVNETTRMVTQLADIVRPVGGGIQSIVLPKTGLLETLFLAIRGTVAGGLSAPNALGMASIVNRVRVTANNGVDIMTFSGAGYHYLLRPMLDSEYIDVVGQSNARSAVTAAAFNLDMVIPFAVNPRDPLGLLVLQNESAQVSLTVDFTADAVVATGATVTCTVTPILSWLTIPPDSRDWPNLNYIHSIIEDSSAVAAAGDSTYNWPRGPLYLQLAHGAGIGAAGADSFSRAQIRMQQANYRQNTTIPYLDMEFRRWRGGVRPAGAIYFDFLATSGLGCYGIPRDWVNSMEITDLASVITWTGAGTQQNLRRLLIPVQPQA